MEANVSVMTTIPICQDLEPLMAPFLNSQLTLTHQPEWDCKCPFFQEDKFISCLKIPNPSLIENQKVRAKIRFGFKVKRFKSTHCNLHLLANGNSTSLTANKVCSKYSRVTE